MSDKKRSRHTASFQLSKFLNSKYSLEYGFLTGNMIAVLRYIYDVMEMTFSHTGVCICKIPMASIAQYSRVGLNTVKRAIPLFIEHQLLSIEQKFNGSTIHFGMGEAILTQPIMGSLYPQAELTEPTVGSQPNPNGHLKAPNRTHHGPTYKKKLFNNSIKKERGRKNRASSLSDDFLPTQETCDVAEQSGLTEAEANDEFLKFMNHYRSEGIEKGDWQLTLRNWFIRAGEYKSRKPTHTKVDDVRDTVPWRNPQDAPRSTGSLLKDFGNNLNGKGGRTNGLGKEKER